jgi:hypothetical protein
MLRRLRWTFFGTAHLIQERGISVKRLFRVVLPISLVIFIASQSHAIEGNWTGTLGPAPAGAKEGVVATITFKEGNKDVVLNLRADGDVAKTLKDWAAKGVKATVRGNMPDETSIKVRKVEKAE